MVSGPSGNNLVAKICGVRGTGVEAFEANLREDRRVDRPSAGSFSQCAIIMFSICVILAGNMHRTVA